MRYLWFSILLLVLTCPVLSQSKPADQESSTSSLPNNSVQIPISTIPQIRNSPAELTLQSEELKKQAAETKLPPLQEQPQNEFQRFVEQTSGVKLKIFGNDLFRNVPSTFAPIDHAPVTGDYAIGPGDELVLKGWGQVDIDYRAVVDRSGSVYIPKVGTVDVAGVKFSQLQPYLKSQIGRVFKNFDLTVSMGQLRAIQVFVVGHATRPGSYTISSLSTLVNAIFASGGPSPTGSMRRIQLKRGNAVIREFDLYQLLLTGDKSQDVALLPQDTVYIPPVGPLVALTGSVGVPAIYELKDHGTLADVLQYAGGETALASSQHATIERINVGTVRTVIDISLTSSASTPLQSGDLISILPMSERFEDEVILRGNVAFPGRRPWKDGMKVSDLFPNPESLITRDYWKRKDELGIPPIGPPATDTPNPDLRMEQKATSPGMSSNSSTSSNNPTGPEQENARQQRAQIDFRNQVKRLAPDINWEYAVIQRIDKTRLNSTLLPFNLREAVLEHDPKQDVLLLPGDIVTIFSQADVKVPELEKTKFVRLEGEFKAAGIYEVEKGETLRHLIERVGGLTNQAYLYGAELTRESIRMAQQKRFDDFVQDLELEIERNASAKAQSAISPEDAASVKITTESQRTLIEKLKLVKVKGRLILGIPAKNEGIGSIPDITLEDGDEFSVPYIPATVNVIGAVYNESSFLFEPSRTAGYYLNKAGGGTREADKSRMFLVRADGTVVSHTYSSGWFGQSLSNTRMLPGDTLVVSEKVNNPSFLRGLKDWSIVVGQFGIGIAAIHTLFP